MSNTQYLDAYREYYKLKKKYDNKLNLKKKKIKKMDISISEKKTLIKQFIKQRPCINCKKSGGTIFTNNNSILNVVCGNENPCNLHIEIQKPQYYDLQNNLEMLEKKINKIKQQITTIKYDLLFELQDKEVVINEFETLKQSLQQVLSQKKMFQNMFDNKNIFIEEIIDDSEELKKVNIIEYIDIIQKKHNNIVYELRKQLKKYKEEAKDSLLNDIIQIYKDSVLPLQIKLRKLKYQEIYINEYKQIGGQKGLKLMPIYHIIPTKITINNRIVSDGNYQIISNKK